MQLYKLYNSIKMVTISMSKIINFKARLPLEYKLFYYKSDIFTGLQQIEQLPTTSVS